MLKVKLKEYLVKQGVSMKHLSKVTGISYIYLSNICNNKIKGFSIDKLEKIIKALNCKLTDIIDFEK